MNSLKVVPFVHILWSSVLSCLYMIQDVILREVSALFFTINIFIITVIIIVIVIIIISQVQEEEEEANECSSTSGLGLGAGVAQKQTPPWSAPCVHVSLSLWYF